MWIYKKLWKKTKLSWASKSCFLMTRTKQDPSVQYCKSIAIKYKDLKNELLWICYCFSAWPTLTTLSSHNCRKKMACFHLFSFTFLSGPGLSRSTSCSLGQPVAETSLGWNLDQKVSSFGMKTYIIPSLAKLTSKKSWQSQIIKRFLTSNLKPQSSCNTLVSTCSTSNKLRSKLRSLDILRRLDWSKDAWKTVGFNPTNTSIGRFMTCAMLMFAFWRLNTNLVLLNPWIRVHRTINLLKSRLIDPTIYIAPYFLTEGNTLLPRFFSWPSWRAKALNDTRYTSSFGAKKTPWFTWGRTLIQYRDVSENWEFSPNHLL